MATTITSKGQVTIPKPVRDLLGLEPGNSVEFEVASDGRVVLLKSPADHPVSRFAQLRGHAGRHLSTDQIMALTRGDR